MKNVLTVLLSLTLAACSLGPEKKDAAATYDLGTLPAPATAPPRIRASLLVHAVAAPSWLESNSIVYRLNYQDAARQLTYANSRWAAPAAALLTQRLRAQLAAASDGGILGIADSARADYALRVELEEFSQVFDSAVASRAVIIARASIVNVARRTLHAQKTFTVDKPAATANAEGGVRALAGASGELIDAVVAWAAASLAQDKK
jgi:cholesterol transport system auxiliary component